MRRARHNRRGLTLIEVTIGLAIAAMMVGVAITGINALTDASLRSAALDLTGAIKFCYDRSIMERRTERLSIDLDKSTFWIDYTDDAFALSGERARGNVGEQPVEDEPKKAKEKDSFFDEEQDDEVKKALEGGKAIEFHPEDDSGTLRRIGDGVKITKLWTGHQEEPFTTGVARIHFFSAGWSEPAQIELSDGTDIITLKLYPLTGRVRSYSRALDAPRVEEDDGREEGDE